MNTRRKEYEDGNRIETKKTFQTNEKLQKGKNIQLYICKKK